jgi:GntR family transcriptional regulator
MLLRITPDDAVPIYRQIVRQVREALASGKLVAGDKLPSLRELSASLVVNHLTVKKAYETLEAEGLIETDRGRGTFVSAPKTKGTKAAGLKTAGLASLNHRAVELCASAMLLGLEKEELDEIVEQSWMELEQGKKK